MTANELADYITENSYIGTVTMEDVAAMLRQQEAEIGCYKIELELHKAMIQDLEKGLDSSINLNKAQAERNNEPVAWMDSWGDVEKFNHNNENWTPLYTHLVKELTDDEIHELANEHLRTQNQDGVKVVLGLEDFARAILRKAQEK